jgi:CRP-like cAMP-binding protein
VTGADLKPFALFEDLVGEEREELAALVEPRSLAAGETLFEEGDESDALVLVATGRIAVSSQRCAEVVTLEAGDALGALALLAVGARETRAVGVEESALGLLRREDFLRFAEDYPRPAMRIAAAVATTAAQRLRAALDADALASVDPLRPAE